VIMPSLAFYRESYRSLMNSANKQSKMTVSVASTARLYKSGDHEGEAKKGQTRCARKTWFFQMTSL
jgi:hypothetical protein